MLRSKARTALDPRHAPLAHVLSCLLLSTLIFSATFGVIHRHGPPATNRVSVETAGVNTADSSDGKNSSTNGPLQSNDCSICQLHQHLSGGLLYRPVFTPAPPEQNAPEPLALTTYLPASSSPRRGRAPPLTSL